MPFYMTDLGFELFIAVSNLDRDGLIYPHTSTTALLRMGSPRNERRSDEDAATETRYEIVLQI